MMTPFEPRLDEMRFALNQVADLPAILALPDFSEFAPDLVESVLEEAGRFAKTVFAPVNQIGDMQHARLENGVVSMPAETRAAYQAFVDGGWNGLAQETAWGGQAFPYTVSIAVNEMLNAANMALSNCPMLTASTVEALSRHGSEALKAIYLEKLVSGSWTGAMNLTEPQAGSDVGALRTRAEPDGDHYLIRGQKIFISFGEHDLSENIIHLVLARLPDAPPGTKGISLFLVPKYLVRADGSLGARNDIRCIGLERKMGLNGSPTSVLAYGETDGAIGYLVGRANDGMRCMFTMMNAARVAVGLQGLGLAERAYQQAVSYARERIQGKPATQDAPDPDRAPILYHPDIRRMLLTMRARIDAARALTYYTASRIDLAAHHTDPEVRAAAQRRADLLVPLVKAWSTDLGVAATSLNIQVLGGTGFMEGNGAAQHFRDARITPIYEGTNCIQANDLVGRKIHGDRGAAARALFAEIAAFEHADTTLAGTPPTVIAALTKTRQTLEATTDWLLAASESDKPAVLAGAVPYLDMFATVVAGWLLFQGTARTDPNTPLHASKTATTRFYATHILSPTTALADLITTGADSILNFDLESL